MIIDDPKYKIGHKIGYGWTKNKIQDYGKVTKVKWQGIWYYYVEFEGLNGNSSEVPFYWYSESELDKGFVERW